MFVKVICCAPVNVKVISAEEVDSEFASIESEVARAVPVGLLVEPNVPVIL